MIKIKNVRPGMLLVTDAGLELAPGAVAELPASTPDIEGALATGHLVRVAAPQTEPSPEPASVTSEVENLTGLQAAEAIARVHAEQDPERLKTWLYAEKRRGVITAIQNRLAGVLPNASG